MIIAIEGVDAAGKSTLCKNLSFILGGIVYATPPAHMRKARNLIDSFASPNESLCFYSKGIDEAVKEIKTFAKIHKNIFLDRFWISTAATHLAMKASVNLKLLAGYNCVDATILLTVNSTEQACRFSKRGMTTGDRNLLPMFRMVSNLFKKLTEKYCKYFFVLDTSNLSVDETTQRVVSYLATYCKK